METKAYYHGLLQNQNPRRLPQNSNLRYKYFFLSSLSQTEPDGGGGVSIVMVTVSKERNGNLDGSPDSPGSSFVSESSPSQESSHSPVSSHALHSSESSGFSTGFSTSPSAIISTSSFSIIIHLMLRRQRYVFY